jgi:soluble lytic murein transglycosylase
MMWRARKRAVPVAFLLLLAGISLTAVTGRTAHAKSEPEKNDTIEKAIVYLKNKNVPMREDKLKKVVHAVYRESRQRDLDYRLALAVIEAESNFRQDAVSNKGARGLMQIMPCLAKYIAKDAGVKYSGDQCLHEPDKNIRLGVYHLARLVEDFKNLPTALHAYNAGETRVKARKSKKEPKTAYTKQVIEEYEKSLGILPDADEPRGKATFPDVPGESGLPSVSSSGKMTFVQLAERLRNTSREAASRSQSDGYKRAFQEEGLQGLVDYPPIKLFPNETPSKIKEKVLTLSVVQPPWEPNQLRLEGVSVSPLMVMTVRSKDDLESKDNRILRI